MNELLHRFMRIAMLTGTSIVLAACTAEVQDDTPQSQGNTLPDCAQLVNFAASNVKVHAANALAVSVREIALPAPATLSIDVPHCRVVGTIDSDIGFELLLPDEWNGKFMMGGGGGFVGSLQNSAEELPMPGGSALERGYATAGTDTGHRSATMDGSWALDNPRAQENFAHRAVHRTNEVSRAIISAYYADAMQRSYFLGCSRGGGQALIAAQRYPQDFDGLIAGAPALDWTGVASGMIRTQQSVFPDPNDVSAPVITTDNRELLSNAILAQCDSLDGVSDGILADPRTCRFDPATLPRCENGAGSQCLTHAQLEAVQSIYSPLVVNGAELYTGWPFGGETVDWSWPAWITQADGAPPLPAGAPPNAHSGFGTALFRYFIYSDPQWSYAGYEFEDWQERSAPVAQLLNATDPDMSALRDRGGKLILWHGWSDAALSALDSIDYYAQAAALDPAVDEYFRMFLLPGVAHCFGGPGADQVDWIGALEQWVEQDIPPERLLSTRLSTTGTVTLQRPVCPYPGAARYDGAGDPDLATSYVCSGE